MDYMKTSKEIIEMLNEIMSSRKGVHRVELCWEARICFSTPNVDSLLAKMHDMSLAYVVGDMMTYCPFDHSCIMIIYLQPSIDGQTNIDVEFMDKLSELTIISIEKKGAVK